MKTDIQKFEIQTLDRKALKNAPYNPRKIKKVNKESLGKAISELGLLEPLVWNKRTGNLVSGHQRLVIIDSQSGHSDYQLDVAVVDLSEKDEAKANIALNNRALQGNFDFPKLKEMAIDFDLDLSEDILDIKTAFSEFLDISPNENYEEEPEEIAQYSSDKIPLIIVLDKDTFDKWEKCKTVIDCKKDIKAFMIMFNFYTEKNKIL